MSKGGGLMGMLTRDNSWTAQANNAAIRRRCPPVEDCPVKNTLRPTAKQRRQAVRAARAAKQAEKLQREAAKAAKAAKRQGTWPNKGSYTPGKTRGRG